MLRAARLRAGGFPKRARKFRRRERRGPAGEVRASPGRYPAAFTAWISSAATFCASPYTIRVLSR
jgi:hypothetical protein